MNSQSILDEDHGLYAFLEQVAADHMTRNVKTVTRDVTLRELGDLFEQDDFGIRGKILQRMGEGQPRDATADDEDPRHTSSLA